MEVKLRWKYLCNSCIVESIQSAFETIDIKILLNILFEIAIWETYLKWFEDYLNKRKQVTKCDKFFLKRNY